MSAKLAFIAAHASEHAVRLMCRVLGIARSWFHAWRRAAPQRAEGAARRQNLFKEIREIFEAAKQRYGAPRIHAELHDRGRGVSKRTIATLMKENGIRPPRGKRRAPITTDSRHAHALAPNLLDRNFEVLVPDTVWLANISYILTDEGWLSRGGERPRHHGDRRLVDVRPPEEHLVRGRAQDGHPNPSAAEGP